MKKMKLSEKKIICKQCGKPHSKKEVERVYGKESTPAILGYCSAMCYTTHILGEPSTFLFL